jgi:hypothetical protein
MPGNTFKIRLKNLDKRKKLVLIGSAIAAIGVFLPWYQDIDKFRTGDMFLGITGPLYLAGLIVGLAAIGALGLIMLEVLEKPKPKLPMKENHFFIAGAGLSLLLLVLASSVYFHHKFGVNLTDKSMGIGMIMAFIGSGGYLAGGILLERGKEMRISEGKLKPLIDLNVSERVQSSLDTDEKPSVIREREIEREKVVQGSINDLEN